MEGDAPRICFFLIFGAIVSLSEFIVTTGSRKDLETITKAQNTRLTHKA